MTSRLSYAVFAVLIFAANCTFGQTSEKKALLVIDVQENLLNPDSRIHIDTAGIDLFFRNLNESIIQFNDNKDFVVYVKNEWTNPFMNLVTGNVCKKGGKGVGIDKRLVVVNDVVYSKSKANSLSNKELWAYLKTHKIKDVYVMGLLAEGCVKATVNGLLKEGFNVIVIEDALGSKSLKNKTHVIAYLRERNVKVIKTEESRRIL